MALTINYALRAIIFVAGVFMYLANFASSYSKYGLSEGLLDGFLASLVFIILFLALCVKRIV